MSGESIRRAPMMNLRETVERYAALADDFGDSVALSAFGLTDEETQNLFSAFDEDYHISRFLCFSCAEGRTYTVSGNAATHVAFDRSIYSLL